MISLDNLKIDLLKFGDEDKSFHFDLDDTFFDLLDEDEIKRGELEADLILSRKTNDAFSLKMHICGIIFIPCDRCLDDMKLNIDTEKVISVRFGDLSGEDEERDNLIILSDKEGILDLSWLIYEYISLEIPLSHVHPDGECDEEMLRYLDTDSVEEYDNDENDDESGDSDSVGKKEIDSRWSKLEGLIK